MPARSEMSLRIFLIIGQGPDSSYEHSALRKEFGYDFLTLEDGLSSVPAAVVRVVLRSCVHQGSFHRPPLPGR